MATFREEKPWLEVYRGHVAPETEVFEGSVFEFLGRAVQKHSGKVALSFFGNDVPFAHLYGTVEKLSAAMSEAGVSKGDRVALMLPNCPQYVMGFFATVKLGAVVTQLNPLYVEREIEYILRDSGAETIFVYADMYERVKAVLPETDLKNVIVVSFQGAVELSEDHHDFGAFLAGGEGEVAPAPVNPHKDLAALQYTGGTTGVSKGAMLTHRNLLANVGQTLDMFASDREKFQNNEGIVGVLPFFHIYGLTCVMMFGLDLGLRQLLIPRFDPEMILNTVRDNAPKFFPAVPTMYMGLLASGADLKEYGFDRVDTFNSGGAALPVNLKRSFEQKAGRPVFEGYGLSETSPVTHNNPTFLSGGREGSIGIPIPSTDARIVDVETGDHEMPVGESGELIIRGPQVMAGYWNMPDETEKALRDGWLYTGDVATMDSDGYFYIVDRKKDMIVAGGYNIYPREVEEVLFEHEAVAEAVAIGVPDEYRGETVKAFVVRKSGSDLTEDELVAFCRERLASYKAPKGIEFREELPKSTVGKLLRRVLADEEKAKIGDVGGAS
ncbi:long-chain-fatty-acid--CoA ligase [Rubrobacter indicoceani]|uniref:long-chain-fatty-acid--CoA ligase n=1 Tax=Rubrobacter indicoceani TaxID=2051957 RepID=UPI000E5C23CF|nr:long-chain fatty acid--CoA ligase [Rubrobacter indicoceani]